jgi:ubiquinone biosynthesis protein
MGMSGDVRGQLASLRDLGAFPPDTDLDAVYADLELDQPVKDPTQMSADELVHEMQDLVTKLLGYGARAPKDLMLFVKNLMFLNAATATLAPDLDLLGEIAHVHAYFLQTHGERLVRELGMDPTQSAVDVDAVKASLLVPPEVEHLTFRDLQERRRMILKRMGEARPRRCFDLSERSSKLATCPQAPPSPSVPTPATGSSRPRCGCSRSGAPRA